MEFGYGCGVFIEKHCCSAVYAFVLAGEPFDRTVDQRSDGVILTMTALGWFSGTQRDNTVESSFVDASPNRHSATTRTF
jgi:hypothetical protein